MDGLLATAGLVGLIACGGPAEPLPPGRAAVWTPPERALPSAPPADAVVASWEGGQLTQAELEARMATELRELDIHYRLSRWRKLGAGLEQVVDEALVRAEAERRGLEPEELLVAEVEEPVDATGIEPGPQREALLSERYRGYLGELRARGRAETLLPYPELPRVEVPIAEHDPIEGPADAAVTIVLFSGFQCTWCPEAFAALDRLRALHPADVRVVHKDFPLQGHVRAIPAAVAAHCAGAQGKYWEMHRLLHANPMALSEADLERYGIDLGLDASSYADCRDGSDVEQQVYADVTAGRELGVEATPTFFVNGTVVTGTLPHARFDELVERELRR